MILSVSSKKIPENSYIRNVNERYVDAFFNKIPILFMDIHNINLVIKMICNS